MSPKPTPPHKDVLPGTATGTCDWGHCDKEAVALRWSPTYPGWLSVCKGHKRSGGPPPSSIRPLTDDPEWGVHDQAV